MNLMQIKISEIRIGRRIRKEIGDIEPLKESMNYIGLLHPIILDMDLNLIAGARRLEAAKELGWESVEVKLVDIKDKKTRLMIELQENITRIDFTEGELETSREYMSSQEENNLLKKTAQWFKDRLQR